MLASMCNRELRLADPAQAMQDMHLSSSLCRCGQQTPFHRFRVGIATDKVAGNSYTRKLKLHVESVACWRILGQRLLGDLVC